MDVSPSKLWDNLWFDPSLFGCLKVGYTSNLCENQGKWGFKPWDLKDLNFRQTNFWCQASWASWAVEAKNFRTSIFFGWLGNSSCESVNPWRFRGSPMQWPKLVVIVGVFLFLFTYRWTHLHIVQGWSRFVRICSYIISYQVMNMIPDRSKYLYFLKMYTPNTFFRRYSTRAALSIGLHVHMHDCTLLHEIRYIYIYLYNYISIII